MENQKCLKHFEATNQIVFFFMVFEDVEDYVQNHRFEHGHFVYVCFERCAPTDQRHKTWSGSSLSLHGCPNTAAANMILGRDSGECREGHNLSKNMAFYV